MGRSDNGQNDEEVDVLDLPSIDLNLLVTLHALLRERSVTRAGESIGLSQPATSAALARLRRHFGDELLTRDGQRYVLTPLATSLLDQAEVALRHVEHTFAARPVFDARTSDREFTVVMSDYALTVLGGELLRLLEEEAPQVRLRVQPTDRSSIDEPAATLRGIDLMVLPRGFLSDLPSVELYRDRWVAICAADNTRAKTTALTHEEVRTAHWIVSYNAPTEYTPADKHLEITGIERRVDVVVQNFLALPFLLAGTQRMAILQQRLAAKLQQSSNISVLELPLAVPELIEAAWWHPSRNAEPGRRWLQELFQKAAAHLGELPPPGPCGEPALDQPGRRS